MPPPAPSSGVAPRAIGWFLPEAERDHVDLLREHLFVVLGFMVTANMALFAVLHTLHHVPGADGTNIVVMLGIAAVNVVLPFALRVGVSLRVLAPVFSVVLQVGVSLLAAYDSGMISGAAFWLVVTPLAAAVLGGSRLGWVAAGISMVAGSLMFGHVASGGAFPTSLRPEMVPLHHFISFLSCTVSVAALAALYEGPMVRNLRHLAGRLGAANARLERELDERRRAQARAEAASRAKDVLLDNLSHEFRTPLTAILSTTNLLASDSNELDRQFLQLIDSGARRLHRTLDAVIDLAWIESAEAALPSAPVEVYALAEVVVAEARAAAEAKGLSIAVVGSPATASANADALRRALAAVVDNAVRFTEVGRVTVTVRPDGPQAVVEVTDTGIGMGRDFLPHAAEPFRQGSEGDARTHEGLGLGLTLAHRLLALMGGTLAVESAEGWGTTVRMQCTAAVPRAEAAAEPSPREVVFLDRAV
ncbi:MAG: HAMP domain-containing sensor histidine kinase [Bacteroidota bacterium]